MQMLAIAAAIEPLLPKLPAPPERSLDLLAELRTRGDVHMSIRSKDSTRRTLLGAAAAGAAFGALPGLIRPAAAAEEFKIGLFIALSGPASLFGPTQKACAELAAEEINKAGGILGPPDQAASRPTPAARPPRSTKSAIRLMLEEKVDLLRRLARQRHARGPGRHHQGQGALHLHAGLRRRRVRLQHLRARPTRRSSRSGRRSPS